MPRSFDNETFGAFFVSTKRKYRNHSLSDKIEVVDLYKTGHLVVLKSSIRSFDNISVNFFAPLAFRWVAL